MKEPTQEEIFQLCNELMPQCNVHAGINSFNITKYTELVIQWCMNRD